MSPEKTCQRRFVTTFIYEVYNQLHIVIFCRKQVTRMLRLSFECKGCAFCCHSLKLKRYICDTFLFLAISIFSFHFIIFQPRAGEAPPRFAFIYEVPILACKGGISALAAVAARSSAFLMRLWYSPNVWGTRGPDARTSRIARPDSLPFPLRAAPTPDRQENAPCRVAGGKDRPPRPSGRSRRQP